MNTGSAKNLAGKVALVTGSSRGIGAAIALRLAKQGANVVINYVSSASAADEVAAKARELGVKAAVIKADVSKGDEIAALFKKAKEELGRIDIVMSNSGIEHFGKLEDVTEEEFDRVFHVNVRAQFVVAQQAHKYIEEGGRLFLIGSVSANFGLKNHAVYASSKAAIQGMVKCLAWDFADKRATVNVIAPGGVQTDMAAENAKHYVPGSDKMTSDEIIAKVGAGSPFNRMGQTDDIANIVALLSSPDAEWITGQTIHCNGGAFMI
ncbi:NAD(P)-binding protein [Xylariaceae sp. FL1651]|nr:NAD(P)-binding protein [Xylariaceae sp. FL1651]